MTFPELKGACEDFRTLLREATGRELIIAVSVDEPAEPPDELHFLKLVSWCYVFLFEASQPAGRYIVSLLRAADPGEHKAVNETFENVNNLRTVRVHNLSVESRHDDYKTRQAHIWLVRNGGEPPDWAKCCRSLCEEARRAVDRLMKKWRRLTANKDDAESAVRELITAVDREWAPHTFDRIVEVAATEIGLSGLDCVRYRESRLDRWRELVGFFESREHAEAAIGAAIRRELEQVFGDPLSRAPTSDQ
jgi:hypothetical protein